MASFPKAVSERLFRRFGHHYIVVMLLATRLCGSVGGLLVVYYVNLTLTLPEQVRSHFQTAAGGVVLVAVGLTLLAARYETRTLRRVLKDLARGIRPDLETGAAAGREAVLFPVRHHRTEAWLVPASTLVPVLLLLKFLDNASHEILANIALAVFMGIGLALMSTYFVIERMMQPVVRYLLEHDVWIDFDSIPASRLRSKINLSFGLVILITALMIGTLARQRAADIVQDPENQDEAVANLRAHTTYITLAAVITGLAFSTGISSSVASRVGHLVHAMKRVEKGSLSERVYSTGNDEIDVLTRQFNSMVRQLAENDHTIRDLNTNLERKVRQRTFQVNRSRQKLARSLRRLKEYDRLKTQFFSNVSHELRTPLTMILSPATRIMEKHGAQLPADVVSMVDVIRINGRRLLDLINRLLEFSKLEAGSATICAEPVRINELARMLVAAASPLAEQRQIRLTLEEDPAIGAIAADREKVETILTNLISNALKFTPGGGSVTVSISAHGEEVSVAVQDSGIGIHPANHGKVFERFVQIDGSSSREFPGTGLGLALVKELVELHGGRIELDSDLGRGARFTVYLPCSRPAQLLDAAPSRPSSSRQLVDRTAGFADLVSVDVGHLAQGAIADRGVPDDAPTVLVVDDTPELRAMIGDVLADQYHVLFGTDGAEGIELTKEHMPDLIISDVMMPGVDGYSFCRTIKEDANMRHIPFVMLTAKADVAMKIEGLDSGADDYLVKPFDTEELRARVRSLLKVRRLHVELDRRNLELEKAFKQLQSAQSELMDMARRAGMTEIATGVLHNVGNVLNSVNVSVTLLGDTLRRSKIGRIGNVADLLETAKPNSEAGADDERIKKIPEYLKALAQTLNSEHEQLGDEVTSLAEKVQHIRNIIRAQQSYTRQLSFKEHTELTTLLDDLLAIHGPSLAKYEVEVVRDYAELPAATIEKSKLLQVIDNLVKNGIESIVAQGGDQRLLTVEGKVVNGHVRIAVTDTGRGIAPEHLKSLFRFGFTTKTDGNGFGLHSSALAMSDLQGTIKAASDGPGQGACFTIEFPLDHTAPTSAARQAAAETMVAAVSP